jgi:hypothetical protein
MINRLPLEFRVSASPNGHPATARPDGTGSSLGERVIGRAAACIGNYPAASLATAFLGGLAIGRWVKGL